MKVSIVIPCYLSEFTISGVVDEIRCIFTAHPEYDYEVIMVSDSSPDNVYNVIRDLCQNDPEHLRGVELSRNFGQHAALMAGFRYAGGDVVISMDDDGQAPTESILDLVHAIDAGADIVFGAYNQKKHHFFRNLGSKINDFMAEVLLNKPKKLKVSSFYAVRDYIISEVLQYTNAYPYLLGLLLRSSKHIVNVPVAHRSRLQGSSGYTLRRLLSLWINGFTAFSVKPLRIATLIGFVCAFFGFLLGFWVVLNKIIHPDVPVGYSSMMAVTIFIGGVLMLILGMIGEYVGRIYICINKSPQYVIRETTRMSKD